MGFHPLRELAAALAPINGSRIAKKHVGSQEFIKRPFALHQTSENRQNRPEPPSGPPESATLADL